MCVEYPPSQQSFFKLFFQRIKKKFFFFFLVYSSVEWRRLLSFQTQSQSWLTWGRSEVRASQWRTQVTQWKKTAKLRTENEKKKKKMKTERTDSVCLMLTQWFWLSIFLILNVNKLFKPKNCERNQRLKKIVTIELTEDESRLSQSSDWSWFHALRCRGTDLAV